MAKAKITRNGNVKVVMTQAQWDVVNSIFQHVRLGDRNEAVSVFSDLMIDLEEFNSENYFDSDYLEVEAYMTYVNKRGNTKVLRGRDAEFCIELALDIDEEFGEEF